MASEEKPKGRVIITYGRSLMALVAARSLAERGVEVIGCDSVNLTVLSFSKHVSQTFTHPDFEREPEAALQALERAVLEYAPDDGRPYVLLPMFRETKFLAKHRERFEPLIKIAAPDAQSISAVHPKDNLARLVESADLAAPKTHVFRGGESEDQHGESWDALSPPLLVKPADGVGGRGVAIASNREELSARFEERAENETLLVQEVIDGEDYCVCVAAEDGQVRATLAYRNVLTFPRESGAGAVRETVDAAPFLETTRQIIAATNWNGVGEIDFRWSGDPHDPPRLIEVNPRFWAGLFHSVETGPDFPWLSYALAAGEKISKTAEPDIGAQTRAPGVWLISAAHDVAASDEQFERAREAWDSAKEQFGEGKLASALGDMFRSLREGAQIGDAASSLHEMTKELESAPHEFSRHDDPLVGLGVLFVLSNIVRHGRLPDELKPTTKMEPQPKSAQESFREKPVIGVTKPEDGDDLAFMAMTMAVRLAGGEPRKLTASAPGDPRTVDGLIFGGGSDVYPGRYAGVINEGQIYDEVRDEMEASWADAAREQNIPVLAVCRGAQMLNVSRGGDLLADLKHLPQDDYPSTTLERVFFRKKITVEPDSLLASAVEKTTLHVNSIHSQAINQLGDGFIVTARDANGVVQAIEDPSLDFCIGVQFHPEFLIHRSTFRKFFGAFVHAADIRRARASLALSQRLDVALAA